MSLLPLHQTNSLLGYPSDARLLIINADDFGMCHAINVAILQTLQAGIVSSTTLMVPCPWAPHAMQLLKENPKIPFGVHLTLTTNRVHYRWGPVSAKANVPSLLDETGYFYSDARIPELLAHAKLDEVAAEFRAQINAVLDAQLRPTHLDWHCLADGGREDIFELTFALAQEVGLALRVHERSAAERLQKMGLPTTDHDVLDSYQLEPSNKAAIYGQMLRALPIGLTEWAVHPSLDDAEFKAMEPTSWQVRKTDFDFFAMPSARTLLDEAGIVLLDYRALQQVWAHKQLNECNMENYQRATPGYI